MAGKSYVLNEELIEESDFLKLGRTLQNPERLRELVARCEKEGRVRVILDRESKEPYMIRYYLKNFRPFGRIVMHNVLRSDIDGLHDHPWGFQSFIIRGGYWETYKREDGEIVREWREPGYSATRTSEFLHRLEVDSEKAGTETWTLFMMGPREKDWGFIDEDEKWIQWEEYLERRKRKAA